MPVIGIRKLAREMRDVVDELKETGEPVIVARHGEPVAIMVPAEGERLVEAEMAMNPSVREGLEHANKELAAGETVPVEPETEEEEPQGVVIGKVKSVESLDYSRLLAAVAAMASAQTVEPLIPDDQRLPQAQEANAKLRALNAKLVGSGLEQALTRARTVNTRLVTLAGGPSHLDWERYLTLLEGATAVEDLGGAVEADEAQPAAADAEAPEAFA